MPTYAILGCTGSTGSALFSHLHSRLTPDSKLQLNVYARSASKLATQHPYTADSPNIHTFVGDLADADLLKDCLRGSNVVFSAVAQNTPEPGCSIAQRTAHSIVSALEALRREEGERFRCPVVVFLSSASLNPVLAKGMPRVLKWVLKRGCYYVYTDLTLALTHLRSHSFIPLVTAEPPALVSAPPTGHVLSTSTVTPMVSYADLGAAMVAMAEEEGWAGKGVGVGARGEVNGSVLPLVGYLVQGLLSFYLPGVWKLGHGRGFW